MATFGVSLPVGVAATNPSELRSLAQQAERCGFDSVWFTDHIVIPRNVQSAYPNAVDGASTFDPDSPMHEVLSTLVVSRRMYRTNPARPKCFDRPIPKSDRYRKAVGGH